MKNVRYVNGGLTNTLTQNLIAVAQDNPTTAVSEDVQRGCVIKAIYYSIDICGLNATGINNQVGAFFFKNPGTNLTTPAVGTEGTSNEKKFVCKSFQGMIMRNQDGNAPLHWEGWFKVPKRYQRMGTNDRWEFAINTITVTSTGHFTGQFIYKWYT